MKTIQENEIEAIGLYLHAIPIQGTLLNKFRALTIKTSLQTSAKMERGFGTFVRVDPIHEDDKNEVKEILEALEKYATNSTATSPHEMSIHGAIMAWRNFIAP